MARRKANTFMATTQAVVAKPELFNEMVVKALMLKTELTNRYVDVNLTLRTVDGEKQLALSIEGISYDSDTVTETSEVWQFDAVINLLQGKLNFLLEQENRVTRAKEILLSLTKEQLIALLDVDEDGKLSSILRQLAVKSSGRVIMSHDQINYKS